MKAIVYTRYGSPDVLHHQEVAKPVPRNNELLIRVRATTVTAGDWHMRKADPIAARFYNGLLRPLRVTILGFELAGDVEAVGKDVTRYKVGDPLFGFCGFGFGAYAEYRCLREDALLAIKPANISYEEVAPMSYGALAALCCLRDKGHVQRGQRVLIIGASGSVGTYAVQIADYLGAEVTGVCSTRNVDMVRALGAAQVIDYTQADFAKTGARYDLIFDAAGKSVEAKARKALAEHGTYVTIMKGVGTESERAQGLIFLKEMIEAGKLKSVIDRCYPLEQTADAHRYVDMGRKQGHVVISVALDA